MALNVVIPHSSFFKWGKAHCSKLMVKVFANHFLYSELVTFSIVQFVFSVNHIGHRGFIFPDTQGGERIERRIGVVGLSCAVPFLIGIYAFNLKRGHKVSFLFAMLSLCSIVISMTLAILNEFWTGFPRFAFGIPIMVLAHGLMNSIFAIPCFFLAIRFEPGSGDD